MTPQDQIVVQEITPQEAYEELQSGDAPVLIDTREPHEHAEVRIEGSKLIPPAMVPGEIGSVVPDKSQRILVQCRSGARSAAAAETLIDMGYEDVVNVGGGILEWEAQGLPTASDANLTPAQRDRYSRHTLLPEVGVDGQVKLLEAKVCLLYTSDAADE